MNMLPRSSITFDKGVFFLETEKTSYIFRLTPQGHLEHVWWGERIARGDVEAAACKRTAQYGSSVMYSPGDDSYCLDTLPQEWAGEGRGDYRRSPVELKTADGGYTTDFRYVSHSVVKGCVDMKSGLPQSCGGAETLSVRLRDEAAGAELTLYYTVYPMENVVTRRSVIVNAAPGELTVRRLMSMCLDMAETELVMTTFEGGWIKEFHRCDRSLSSGRVVNESRTGFSSNRANPGFLLSRRGTGENRGEVWGFNLVYSGNHQSSAEAAGDGTVRVMCGMSPERFEWPLKRGESFESPEAVLSYSGEGFNGLSHNMHDFINRRIVRGEWAGRERPVLVNDWEGCMFSFTREKLLDIARRGKKAGAELFVLDDGWFGARNDDKAGLGDYNVNKKKLPDGLDGLSRRIVKSGMAFGLWFEPEAVNEDSDLYRAHPDWAIADAGWDKVYGRNELLLDLTKKEVRDYIVASMGAVLDSADISYVKWDMNRHLAGGSGAFAHRYILGLYEVLGRVFGPRPKILLESCASGGNRFDLGMLCYSPQIWVSDNTDPIERLDIQKGASYLYPLSVMGAHVTSAPHAQTLRKTPLSTRFNVSCFGCLGYEMDMTELYPVEQNEIKAQTAFYKKHRRTFQYGDFYRSDGEPEGEETFTVAAKDGSEAIIGHFRRLVHSAPGMGKLRVPGLDKNSRYHVTSRPQTLRLDHFGRLIAFAMPVRLKPDGGVFRRADRLMGLKDCREEYDASGAALLAGIPLKNLFNGTGYNEHIRLPGDFGSNLYVITRDGKAK